MLLRNENYVSVRYDNQPNLGGLTNSSWQSYHTVTVDLATGRALTPEEIYRPGSAGRLVDLWRREPQVANCTAGAGAADLEVTREDLGESVLVAFTRDHASFSVVLELVGGYAFCGTPVIDVPYDELTEVLDPALVDKLTAG